MYETHWDQDSKAWIGLQIADIGATVISTVIKIQEQISFDRNNVSFDLFTQEIIKQGVDKLLDKGKRTHKVVELRL